MPSKAEREKQEMSEYGEPWKEDGCCAWADNGEGVRVADCWTSGKGTCDRIVACVNALAGIPNPEAVRELIEAAKAWRDTRIVLMPTGQKNAAISRLFMAVSALSAPSASPQQK